MRLSALLSALPAERAPLRLERAAADDDPVIRGLSYDSRAVAPGDLFFALRGAQADGHEYLEQALELGAAALVVEEIPPALDLRGRPAVLVPDSRRALAPISTRFFGDPSSGLTLIGVTGTNGKTSTTYLLESILAGAGRSVGLIGTVEIRYAGERRRSLNTTPESFDLQRTLRVMRTREIEVVAMEVSSHGLELGRVDGCQFDVAAFTNLTQEHLDFHRTMESYRAAKLLLFQRHLARGASAVVNVDDPSSGEFLRAAEAAGARLVRVSRDPEAAADVVLEDAQVRVDGTSARVRLPSGALAVSLPLVGDFNLENMLVACGVAVALDVEPRAIGAGITGCPQVPGRVERVGAEIPGAPTVFVDYAHTPDAVEKLLRTLRPLTGGRLITVFGCGGDRDRSKRPLMAEAVGRWSDRILATSDNPRTEDPQLILNDVVRGLAKLRRVDPDALEGAEGSFACLVDRRTAIDLAIRIAREEDTVAIAGKGHEDYQIVGRERLPFSDVEEAYRALENRGRE
ncbi:MAG: UDP-N-acetylmuramoyl-L-alanyl-D-glutamate--2,6-diaminopimelate ligase [Myxococcota bacterium]